MADTIVNTPGQPSGNDASVAGWVVAIIILLAVIIGGVYLFSRAQAPAAEPQQQPETNINVTLPSSGGAGEGTGAAQQ